MELIYQAVDADHGLRAVDILVRRTGMSRLMSKKIRLYGRLTCNGQPHRMVDPVRSGDILVAAYQASAEQPSSLNEVAGVLTRYLDDWVLVVSKPAGMVTHPTYLHETGSLTSSLADYPLHPVSRLDRDTSGLVLVARNGHAHHVIASRPMRKLYLAVIHGRLPAPAGLVQAPIQRSAQSIMLREVHPAGADARTIWRELAYFKHSHTSLVRFELLTGRTHQIRVHCLACGCPLVGDGLYGNPPGSGNSGDPDGKAGNAGDTAGSRLDSLIGRQALHAASLQFTHPLSGQVLRLTAPLPADFRALLSELFRLEHQAQTP